MPKLPWGELETIRMNDMTLATLWGGLQAEASRLSQRTLRDLFDADANPFFSCGTPHIFYFNF